MEKEYKHYNSKKIYHFRWLDELEIYFDWNIFESWKFLDNSTWEFISEYKYLKKKHDIFNFDFNTNINHSNNPDTIVDYAWIRFNLSYAASPNKNNYISWYALYFTENNESFKGITILFANKNKDGATESKNKLVLHGKIFAVYSQEYIYYIIKKLFNNKLLWKCKRFDITLDIAKTKQEILTKEQYKLYTEDELENKNRNEKKLCCSDVLWKGETLVFGSYKSRYSWLRIYDKKIETQKNKTTSLYSWITEFKNLNRFEIQFWDKIAMRYSWKEILWNKDWLVKKLFNSEIKSFIPQISHNNFSEYDKKTSIIDDKYKIWELNKASVAQTKWRINTILKNAWQEWLCEILFSDLNENQKDELVTYIINYVYKWAENKNKYINKIDKNKNILKWKNKILKLRQKNNTLYSDIDDVVLLIEEYLYNPETYKKALSLLSLVINKLKTNE